MSRSYLSGVWKKRISKIAATADMEAPIINGTALPKDSHKKPQMTLAGSNAIPAIVECSPSMVPFSLPGAISAIRARSTPAVIAVKIPYKMKIMAKDTAFAAKARE